MQLLLLTARPVSWHKKLFRGRGEVARAINIDLFANTRISSWMRTRALAHARSREEKGERKSRTRGTSAKYDVVRSLRPKKTNAMCYFLPRARRAAFGHARIINDLAENYDHKGHACC